MPPDAPADRRPSTWQRLLDNKTGPQRLLISLGALAAALIAIGGVVTAVVRVFDDDDGGAGSNLDRAPGETQRIESGEDPADRFVAELLDHDGGVVALDHRVIGEPGPADVSLLYNCTDTSVCSLVRLQDMTDEADLMADGRWFKGCYAVTQVGNGFGAESLDIQLRYQAEACA